ATIAQGRQPRGSAGFFVPGAGLAGRCRQRRPRRPECHGHLQDLHPRGRAPAAERAAGPQVRAAARTFVRDRGARVRRAGRRQRLGDGLRRHQDGIPAAVRAARPPLPQRGRGAGEPDQRAPGDLDLGPAQARAAATVGDRGARDVHVGLPVPGAVAGAGWLALADRVDAGPGTGSDRLLPATCYLPPEPEPEPEPVSPTMLHCNNNRAMLHRTNTGNPCRTPSRSPPCTRITTSSSPPPRGSSPTPPPRSTAWPSRTPRRSSACSWPRSKRTPTLPSPSGARSPRPAISTA